ncbi:MAG: hypothetical protein WEE67_04000 [Chloroflexota bacterium]
MTFDPATSLRLIAESLTLVDRLGASPIRLRGVRVTDRTLVVETDVESDDPMAVRAEIANVMGALSGLDVPGLFPVLGVQSIGVRAYTAGSDEELMWIVSSIEAARFIANGQPIEWLSGSLVQENTPAYRRSQADRRIGQVESALRELIDDHGSKQAGDGYVAQLWSASDRQEMRKHAEAEGRDADEPGTLLEFTYLPQLRDAIVEQTAWFDDGCLVDPDAFEEAMKRLNKVRRKVAHHRPITAEDLRTCNEAADLLLAPIGRAHPDLAADFVVDRWEARVAEIVAEVERAVQAPSVPRQGEASEVERRTAAVAGLEAQQAGIVSALDALDRLVVPAPRRTLHEATLGALIRWREGLAALLALARRPNASVAEVEAAHGAYSAALGEVRDLSRKIQELRVAAPSA